MFEPYACITRAEFVKMTAEAAGAVLSDSPSGLRFEDVKPDDWYAPYVAWAAENGIVRGVTSSEFRPSDFITRQDMAVIISKCADVLGITLKEEKPQTAFSDAAEISSYAADAAERLQRAGIIEGRDDGRFAPGETAVRAEACKITALFIEQMESAI